MALTTPQNEFLTATLTRMVNLLGIAIEMKAAEDDRGVTLQLRTEEPGRIIGRKGRSVESLEYLLNRIAAQKYEGFPRIRIDVDGYGEPAKDRTTERQQPRPDAEPRRERDGSEQPVRERPVRERDGGERQRDSAPPPRPGRGQAPGGDGDERWAMVARDAAKEVKRWGEPKTIGPLDTPSRRAVHLALRDDPEIESESGPEAAGGRKKVTIRAVETGAEHDGGGQAE